MHSGMQATAAASTAPSSVYVIQGREVRLPVEVRDASAGVATFVVPSSAARRLIPHDGLDVAEILPGRTLCSLAAIVYRDNDLGRYNEVSITFFVRERVAARRVPYLSTASDFFRGRVGTYIHWLPVTGSFTCDAGRTLWGFPKTVEDIDITTPGDRAVCTLVAGGVHVLTLSVPRGGTRTMPETPMLTYTVIDGALHKTAFTQAGTGLGFRLGGARLSLGPHPYADQLRSLGLPKRAVMNMWTERMHGRFEAATRV